MSEHQETDKKHAPSLHIDRKSALLALAFLIFLAGMLSTKSAPLRGLILITGIIFFGGIALFFKETKAKMIGLAALILLSIINIAVFGIQFGIDFSGGTKIPVLLDKRVDQNTMSELIDIIQKRANALALSELKVKAIGDSEISVELPSGDEGRIKEIENALSKQGVFLGVVDGAVAVSGDDVYPQNVQPALPQQLGGRADWGISFSVTRQGAERFAKAAKGKGNYPIYMFLDRPENAIVVMSMAQLKKATPDQASDFEVLKSAKDALKLNGDDIEIVLIDNIKKNKTNFEKQGVLRAVIANDTPKDVRDVLLAKNITLKEVPPEDMSPTFLFDSTKNELSIENWRAIGLLSSPRLSGSIADGLPNYNYVISGSAQGNTPAERQKSAQESSKLIETVLKSGSLPVQISIGSRTSIPATLGGEFLRLSIVGILAALIAIGILIAVRYQSLRIILPIVAISVSEFIILLAILGSFTIDLAAVAGIIAAIGVGVDAQIVITDEIRKKSRDLDAKIKSAFEIIRTNTIVAIVAMLPLLLLGPVQIVGFAISTILGSILGFLLSRPAYAILAKRVLGHDVFQEHQEHPEQ